MLERYYKNQKVKSLSLKRKIYNFNENLRIQHSSLKSYRKKRIIWFKCLKSRITLIVLESEKWLELIKQISTTLKLFKSFLCLSLIEIIMDLKKYLMKIVRTLWETFSMRMFVSYLTSMKLSFHPIGNKLLLFMKS